MPGPSFVTEPRSVSARFQDYLRRAIVERGERAGIRVIDLAALLRERYGRTPGEWFFPGDGHLTEEGHCVVAEELSRHLSGGEREGDGAWDRGAGC